MNEVIRIPCGGARWTRFLAMLFAAVLSWFVWRDPGAGPGVWVARAFGLFIFLVSALTGEIEVDPHRGQVRRRWRLFGRLPIFTRTFSSGSVREVRWRSRWVEGVLDSDHRVDLVMADGTVLLVAAFSSSKEDRTCAEANALGLQLAECLRLPFRRESSDVRV